VTAPSCGHHRADITAHLSALLVRRILALLAAHRAGR
jgi:hypothetical protein